MLRMQLRVAFGKPVGGAKVQGAAVAVQQRCIRAVADERVDEVEPARVGLVGAHEVAAQERARIVGRVVEEMPQHGEVEATERVGESEGRSPSDNFGCGSVQPAVLAAPERGGVNRKWQNGVA